MLGCHNQYVFGNALKLTCMVVSHDTRFMDHDSQLPPEVIEDLQRAMADLERETGHRSAIHVDRSSSRHVRVLLIRCPV